MMLFIYNIVIRFYRMVVGIVARSNNKAKLWVEGRKGIFKKLELIQHDSRIVWFHCASLGEFEQGRPVIEAFKEKHPDSKVLLTFFSPSGYEIRKNYLHADYIFYLPLDTASNAKRFLQCVQPSLAIFVKYEFWYNYLNELQRNEIPVLVISSIFRPEQLFFKPWGKWYRNVLFNLNHIFVQNRQSVDLLDKIGVSNVSISGDTRFDRVSQIAASVKSIEQIEDFKDGKKLFIAGSSWNLDEEIISNYINHTNFDLKFIFAPHEIDEQHVTNLCKMLKTSFVRYSCADEHKLKRCKVLIIDNVGMLASAYKYADITYVGGAFKTGLHNVLEPAAFGVPVICGPDYHKFQEAVDLADAGGLISIDSIDSFTQITDKLASNTRECKRIGSICSNYVKKKQGATALIMNYINTLLS